MRAFALLLLAFAAPGTAKAAPGKDTITIGLVTTDRSDSVERNGKRLAAYLKSKTGLKVKSFVTKDYDDLIVSLGSGKVDFAILPPFSLVKAEASAGAHVLLKAVRHGVAVYYGAVIVRAESNLQTLEDLKGHSMAWVGKSSATGYLAPRAALAKKGFDPDAFFSRQTFEGTHEDVVRAVFEKRSDAGATWVNEPEAKVASWHLYLRKPGEKEQIRVLWVSDPIPGDALAVTSRLWSSQRAEAEKVSKVVQRMGEAIDGQQILRDLYGIDQMVPATPRDFEALRAAAKALPTANPAKTH